MPATPTPWADEPDPAHPGRSRIVGPASTGTSVLAEDLPPDVRLEADPAHPGQVRAVQDVTTPGVVVGENIDPQDAGAIVAEINAGP